MRDEGYYSSADSLRVQSKLARRQSGLRRFYPRRRRVSPGWSGLQAGELGRPPLGRGNTHLLAPKGFWENRNLSISTNNDVYLLDGA